MAATLTEILDAIEDAIDGIDGLRVKDVVGPDLPVTGNAAAAVIFTPDVPSYRSTFGRGVYELDIDVGVFTSANIDRVGQRKLAAFASQTGVSSLRAAVESDSTLGGVVADSYLARFRRLGIEEVGVIGYFGGIFTVHIAASGV
jgi:hypothetical protein